MLLSQLLHHLPAMVQVFSVGYVLHSGLTTASIVAMALSPSVRKEDPINWGAYKIRPLFYGKQGETWYYLIPCVLDASDIEQIKKIVKSQLGSNIDITFHKYPFAKVMEISKEN